MRETTYLCVEIMNSKTTSKLETWSGGTTSRFLFDVNVKLNLSKVFIWRKIGPARRVTVLS